MIIALKNGSGEIKLKNILKIIIIMIPALILTFLFMFRGKMPVGALNMISVTFSYIFFNSMFFLMLYTNKTDKYRSAIYTTTAVFFVISFISHMIEARGSMSFTDDTLLDCKIPFCHIVTTMALIPYVFTKTIIFPGSLIEGYAAIGSMILIWLLASFTIGRGWCGWACFFGGLDDGFSRILKRPVIKEISHRWKYLPFVVFLLIAIGSAYLLQPLYCTWFCPFKVVTEYDPLTSPEAVVKLIICLALFFTLVVALPILTKKRTQCSFFCPFGAMQSFTNYISPFEIKVDTAKCAGCGLCVKSCPTVSISEDNFKSGAAGITCVRCGKCVDVCPKGAISYHIKGVGAGYENACRILSLYAFFIFMSAFLSHSFINGVYRLLNFITTGSFI